MAQIIYGTMPDRPEPTTEKPDVELPAEETETPETKEEK
jgi:hypothetical protein